MPLVNEVVIGLKDKDRFNASKPSGDTQFAQYVTNPTLPVLLGSVLGLGNVAPSNAGRTDLQTVFLTGIAGVNQMATVTPSEMLRLNTAIAPVAFASQNRLGIVGEIVRVGGPQNLGMAGVDLAGFPNGRRPKDDVVDVALVAVMGGLCMANGTTNALGFGAACTPSAVPLGATSLNLHDAVDQAVVPFLAGFPYLNTPTAARNDRSIIHKETTMKQRRITGLLLAGALGLALSACGGGGDGGGTPAYDTATAQTPPDTASLTAQGFLEFIDGMSKLVLDGREPFDLTAFMGPADNADTAEPVRLSIDQ